MSLNNSFKSEVTYELTHKLYNKNWQIIYKGWYAMKYQPTNQF